MTEQHERERFEAWLRNEHNVTMPELAYKFNPALWEGFQAGAKAARANSGWLPPNDADVVDIIAAAIGNELHPSIIMQAYAALKALSDNGYRIVKEG